MDLGVHKKCHKCEGIMVLDYEDEWIWNCTWCGINELHVEFVARIKASEGHY